MTKTHLRTTVSTTNPTRTDLKSNPRDQWLTTQHKAWLVSKISYTTYYFPHFGGERKKKTVNVLPDHPLPSTKTSYRLSVQFSPYNTWEIFLADPLYPPKIPQTTQLVGAYCPHLQANKFKPLYNNEYIFSPHTINTLLWLLRTFSLSELILFHTNKISSTQKLEQSHTEYSV